MTNELLPSTEDKNTGPMFISLKEACAITGIGRNKMLEFAKMKGFPCIRTPHRIQIDKDMIMPWLRTNYGRYRL